MADQRGRISVKLVDPTTNSQEATVTAANALKVDVAATSAALADATANPTTSLIGAPQEVYNGTTWDRQRAVTNGQDSTGTGIAAAGILGQLDDTSTGTVTENQFAPVRISTRRALLIEGVASGTNINVALAATSVTVTVAGGAASDSPVTGNPLLGGGRASSAVPSAVSTDGDAVAVWLDRSGGTVINGRDAHDAALDANTNPALIGGRASAAAPSDVSADGDAVRAWFLRNGAQSVVVTAAGALIGGDATNGLDVDVTRVTGTVTVDTELSTAAALADNTANPTTSLVGGLGHGFDGTTWDRLRVTDATDGNAALTTTGVQVVGVGPGFSRRFNPSNLGTANNSASTIDTNGAGVVGVQVNTSTTGTYVIEATNDGTTWVAPPAINSVTGASVQGSSLTPTVGDMFVVGVNGYRQMRLRTNSTLGATMAHVFTVNSGTELQKVSSGGAVDTELPAAVALADATSTPTVPGVGAFLMGWNGTNWDRVDTANTGRLQVDVVTGGGSDTPTNPATTYVTSASLAAGASVNLDTADIGAKKLNAVQVWASVPFKAEVRLISNGTPDTNPRVIGGGAAYTSFNFKTPHRNYFTLTSTAGTDAFRVGVTNLDNNTAADVYATFQYED